MKKVITSVVCLMFLTTPVFADMGIKLLSRPYGTTSGGAFNVEVLPSVFGGDPILDYQVGNIFQTFCVELNENLGFGGSYKVDLSDSAILGGLGSGVAGTAIPNGPIAGGDPISDGTIRLYKNWLRTAVKTDTLANLTQNAIWYGENEYTAAQAGGAAVTFYNDAENATGSIFQGFDDSGTVKVMNLYRIDASGDVIEPLNQSLLVHVPVPGALLLGFLGLSAAGIRLRKYA